MSDILSPISLLVLLVTAIMGGVLFLPRLRGSALWRATVTPLASIIGSGFLVLGPILAHHYGWLAPVMMAALCLGAWGFGAAIRENIARLGQDQDRSRPEALASAMLSLAYLISVAYYLNLFGAFFAQITPWPGQPTGRIVTTLAFLVVFGLGYGKGFRTLERAEYVTVCIKLAIIAGLLAGLALFMAGALQRAELFLPEIRTQGWPAITLAFGLLVTVQGFETARYLGSSYDAPTRIRAMKLAQVVATAIYMLYVLLLVYAHEVPDGELTETSIIGMMGNVSAILPVMLILAALAAQFSAAAADTSGAGGLVQELTRGKISARQGYALLCATGLVLTWTSDVFSIIAYASRAFALYYAAEAGIAARYATGARRLLWIAMALLGLAIAVFGIPAEG